jgi:hypothetical protein
MHSILHSESSQWRDRESKRESKRERESNSYMKQFWHFFLIVTALLFIGLCQSLLVFLVSNIRSLQSLLRLGTQLVVEMGSNTTTTRE